MYYLSLDATADFRKSLQQTLISGKFPKLSREDERGMVTRIVELDRNFKIGRPLAGLTTFMLQELNGERELFNSYENLFYRRSAYRSVSSDLQTAVARAMVLADRKFGLADEILLNLFMSEFELFAGHQHGSRFLFSDSERLSPEDFLEKLKSELLKFDGHRPPQTAVTLADVSFYPQGRNPLALSLILEPVAEGVIQDENYIRVKRPLRIRWELRGIGAKLRRGAQRLEDGLNAVVADFERRLLWMEDYRTSSFHPPLDDTTIHKISAALEGDYASIEHLDLKGGVWIGKEWFKVATRGDSRARAYPKRCVSCSQITELDFVVLWSKNPREEIWDAGSSYKLVNQNAINSMLLQRHSESSCREHISQSSRTGGFESTESRSW